MARLALSSVVFLVACGHPAQPAQPAEPQPLPGPPAETSTPDAAPEPVTPPKPATCADGRDDSPPDGTGGTLCIGDITTEGGVNVGALRTSILNNVAAFKSCYTPDLGVGTATASMLLLRVGAAGSVEVDGFVPSVTSCLARELAHTQFPYLDVQTRVVIPITFGPQKL